MSKKRVTVTRPSASAIHELFLRLQLPDVQTAAIAKQRSIAPASVKALQDSNARIFGKPEDARAVVRMAEQFEKGAALAVLGLCAEFIGRGAALPGPFRRYLVRCIGRLQASNGRRADRAFLLARPGGGRMRESDVADIVLAAEVMEFRNAGFPLTKHSRGPNAFEKAAEACCTKGMKVSEGRAIQAWNRVFGKGKTAR